MPLYRTNGTQETGGQTIGILCLDESTPFVPGDVNNAGSYGFPVKYRRIAGLRSADLVGNGGTCPAELLAAASDLEAQGVRGIFCDSAHLLPFQQQLADAVRVPVAVSSLLQLPLVASSLAPEQTIGILTAAAPQLSAKAVKDAVIGIPNPLAIHDLENEPGIRQLLQFKAASDANGSERSGPLEIDTAAIREDLVRAAMRLVSEHPATGALILACGHFPPYARAVQEATDLPVFDALTLARLMFAVTHPQRYQGYV